MGLIPLQSAGAKRLMVRTPRRIKDERTKNVSPKESGISISPKRITRIEKMTMEETVDTEAAETVEEVEAAVALAEVAHMIEKLSMHMSVKSRSIRRNTTTRGMKIEKRRAVEIGNSTPTTTKMTLIVSNISA
jgi:hypothetical protein